MDFEPCFKVYNLVSIRPKSMKLSQMTNLNVIFQFIDWLQFETRPSSPLNFGMAIYKQNTSHFKNPACLSRQVNKLVTHSWLDQENSK